MPLACRPTESPPFLLPRCNVPGRRKGVGGWRFAGATLKVAQEDDHPFGLSLSRYSAAGARTNLLGLSATHRLRLARRASTADLKRAASSRALQRRARTPALLCGSLRQPRLAGTLALPARANPNQPGQIRTSPHSAARRNARPPRACPMGVLRRVGAFYSASQTVPHRRDASQTTTESADASAHSQRVPAKVCAPCSNLVHSPVLRGDASKVVGGGHRFAGDALDEVFWGVAFALGVDLFG